MRAIFSLLVVVPACGSSDPAGVGGEPPDAIPVDAVQNHYPPEVDGMITINEVMAANGVTVPDVEEWVELYNPGDVDLDLHGYGLTDDLASPLLTALPPQSLLPAHGYLLVMPETLGFDLSKEPGALGLARPDGSWVDRIEYGAQETDFSAAREPDGSDLWVVEWHPTPGAPMPTGNGQPMGLEDPSAAPEQVPPAGDRSEHVLGYDEIPQFDLAISTDGMAALEDAPFDYVPGTITFEGRSYGPVGVRLKGVNSFEPITAKPSFRVNVDQYVPSARFWGLKDLTLDNMDDDKSMMHERIAYWVARQSGVPASRANHAVVRVNGQPYGLYANVETVKRSFLERNFADPDGPLFEGTNVDFIPSYVDDYELESGPNDRTQLTGVAQAMTLATADQRIAAAAAHADLASLRQFIAVCAVIGQFDSFPYSQPGDDYYVYADPSTGKLAFMPWGMDETFFSGDFDVTRVYSVLARACQGSASCWQQQVDAIWSTLAALEALGWVAEVQRVAAQIAPLVAADPRKPYTAADVEMFQGAMVWFTTNRRSQLQQMLPL